MKLFLPFVLVAALGATSAEARSLEIHGVTGFLSEYDLSASVSGAPSNGIEDMSGPLDIKHVGLCEHAGPNETLSELKLKFVSQSYPVIATLILNGRECTYRGYLSKNDIGVLTCVDGVKLPLRLWAQ